MTAEQRRGTVEPNLDEVREAEAPPSVQATFAEIRSVLRVPFVDQLWRVLGTQPSLLESAWKAVAAALGDEAAERAADRLRQDAVIPLALGMPAHKAFRGDMSRAEIGADDREKISNFTMAAHYVLPKLLLASAILSRQQTGADSSPERRPLPRGVAEGAPRVEPVAPGEVFGQAVELFAEIRARHGYEALPDYYRSIVRAGDFLRLAWNALSPIVGDPEYYSRADAVARQAVELAATLPRAEPELVPQLGATESARVQAVTTFYLKTLLPQTLVEVTIVKGLMDGPVAAAHNRYSLTERMPAPGAD